MEQESKPGLIAGLSIPVDMPVRIIVS
jgi:hypothetical protein